MHSGPSYFAELTFKPDRSALRLVEGEQLARLRESKALR
jgi:hypothetical protein